MCGIAGIAWAAGIQPDAERLRAMADALTHRGPDGTGGIDLGQVALRHTRLSIVDLEGGAQPLTLGPVVLVANGEIYNDLALRSAMPELAFKTRSDCEPPLALWPREGMHYAESLRGMYAIALTNCAEPHGELVLSRDPFGIKPLYIAEFEGGVAFASEPNALLAGGFGERNVIPAAREAVLALQFTPGLETIYPGITRVAPGETLRILNGKIVERRRVAAYAAPSSGPPDPGEGEALRRLDEALLDSVAAHERADVPFGLFLSGGIDSTAILAAMRKLGRQRPMAWTACFDTGERDETGEAARIAKIAGAEHHVMRIDKASVFRRLPSIVQAMDDPVADYAIIPSWFLAKEARKTVKVVLSGEGGDELFGGYGRYRRALKPWWRGGRAPWTKAALDVSHAAGDWRIAMKLDRGANGARSAFSAAQELDIAEWLPNDLLIKLDRCLMAHGVEGRTPLLDPAVAKVAASLPDALKHRDGQGKYLLRRWLDNNLPEAAAFAPKQGFTVPVGHWIASEAKQLSTLVAACPGIAECLPASAVSRIFDAGSRRGKHRAAWHVLFYALWHQIHIRGISADGDLFETLAA